MRENGAVSNVLATIALVIMLVVGIIGFITITNTRTKPVLEISGVSLSSNQITTNSSATLSFTVKNNDETKPHDVTAEFDTTSSVLFYLNNEKLPSGNDGFQYYPMRLQSSEKSTYSFKVTGTLAGGAQSSTYLIRLFFLDENGTKFDTETQSLTVNNP